jgi:hypothetical protein
MTGRYKALLALLLLAGSCQLSAKTYILCVGIQNYPGTENDVFLCAKDAKTVRWLFQKNGNAESVLLTNSEATRGNILTAFAALAAACGPDDALAIFYSGHGEPGVLDTYDHELDYRQLCDLFGKSRARYKFAFINACFSGTMRKEYNEGVMNQQEVMFFLSSRSGEPSQEIITMKNGVFTTYLLQGLRGSADVNRDRVITARELFDYVSAAVASATQGRQHPVMWGTFSNDMPIMVWK